MHRIAKLSARWLSNYGMTIGIADVTPSEDLKVINTDAIKVSYEAYDNYQSSYKRGEL
jgi:DNA-directed RNA polymerase III subunit RPC1